MGSILQGSFSGDPEEVTTQALLFDFDGTIIDSTAAIVKHWHKQGKLIGVDPETILATSHGRRSIDVFQVLDPSKANWEYVSEQERLIPIEFGSDAEEIPGARILLARMHELDAPWALVTSGSKALVQGWTRVLKLTEPKTMVVAEDVSRGKPDPEPYLLGRQRLGLPPGTDSLVFEDAPSGVRSGKAAGFKVIGLATTHSVAQLKEAGADWIVHDLQSVTIKGVQKGLVQIEIRDAYLES